MKKSCGCPSLINAGLYRELIKRSIKHMKQGRRKHVPCTKTPLMFANFKVN